MKSKIPKIISAVTVVISLILALYFSLPSFWFWVSFEVAAALFVVIGCGGEWWLHHHPAGRKKHEKDEHHRLESRFIGCVVIGVTMELFALGHTIREGAKLENDVALAKKRAANAESSLAVLNNATIELAHQYDLSTNALAEANMRILSVSNAAAMNSPLNAPIQTAGGECVIGIEASDAPSFQSHPVKIASLTLRGDNPYDLGISIQCWVDDWSSTNQPEDIVLHFKVDGAISRKQGPWSKNVSFANLRSAQVELIGLSNTHFRVKGGFLRLEVNSLYECSFDFPAQTNIVCGTVPRAIGPIWGFFGERRKGWDF